MQPREPIPRSSLSVRDGDDGEGPRAGQIDDEEGEPPQDEPTGSSDIFRPKPGRLGDFVESPLHLEEKAIRCSRATLPVVAMGLRSLSVRCGVESDCASLHVAISIGPDEPAPKRVSSRCPPGPQRPDGPFQPPTPQRPRVRNLRHPSYRAAAQPAARARIRGGRGPRMPVVQFSTPCQSCYYFGPVDPALQFSIRITLAFSCNALFYSAVLHGILPSRKIGITSSQTLWDTFAKASIGRGLVSSTRRRIF